MNSKAIKYVTIAGVVTIIAGLIIIPKLTIETKDDKKEEIAQQQLNVTAVIVEPKEVEDNLIISGTLNAYEDLEIKPEVSGRVTEIKFSEGARVNRGDLLVKLNDSDLRAELQRGKERLKLLESIELRQRKLLEKKGVSVEEYEIALNELNIQKSQIAYTEAQLEKTEIRAPFSGVIGIREISLGAVVSPQTLITTLQVLSKLKLDFTVPQRYSGELKVGSEVKFRIPPDSKEFAARIYVIEPRIDRSTRTIRLRAEFDNKYGILPGTYAEVEAVKENSEKLMLLPTQALIPDMQSDRVFVYNSGLAEPRKVKTGFRNEKYVSITNGLQSGDTVIVSGIMMLRPGMPVRITIN